MDEEISWYNPSKAISKAMRDLALVGFSPSGHGCGLGGEDWSISKDFKNGYIYVSFSSDLNHSVSLVTNNTDEEEEYEHKRPSEIVKIAKKLAKKYPND